MPGRYFTRRRSSGVPRYTSIKNVVNFAVGTLGTLGTQIIAKAVNTPLSTVATDVSNGCSIQAIYVIINGCGLGGTGVQNNMFLYIIKNVGANLTLPLPTSTGTSNEKRFIIKEWEFMIMRNQDGNLPFHWEGWLPIPKKYQRMATDDIWNIAYANTSALTGHLSMKFIYKWKR